MLHSFAKLHQNLMLALALLVALSASCNAWADSGKELFDKECASCHTIGGGDGVGPDLKGVGAKRPATWLLRVIMEPEKLTAEKDPVRLELAKKFGMAMPDLGISGSDAKKIVEFLGAGAAQAKGETLPAAASAPQTGESNPAAAPNQAEVVVTKELLAKGVALFNGKEPFAKGGAPCVSCHRLSYPGINGGALAADLTGMHAKMGDNGVRGSLKSLGFPVMKKIYADRPLTEEEITALAALIKDASAKKSAPSDPYPLAGLGFFALCLVAAISFKRSVK